MNDAQPKTETLLIEAKLERLKREVQVLTENEKSLANYTSQFSKFLNKLGSSSEEEPAERKPDDDRGALLMLLDKLDQIGLEFSRLNNKLNDSFEKQNRILGNFSDLL